VAAQKDQKMKAGKKILDFEEFIKEDAVKISAKDFKQINQFIFQVSN
jgi:hypothetical protein